MSGKFELKKGRSGKFSFNLKAVNGQVILTSQTYKTKAAAKNGIKRRHQRRGNLTLFYWPLISRLLAKVRCIPARRRC
jgi:uncharacterized protein YegP (UPF0339 family)